MKRNRISGVIIFFLLAMIIWGATFENGGRARFLLENRDEKSGPAQNIRSTLISKKKKDPILKKMAQLEKEIKQLEPSYELIKKLSPEERHHPHYLMNWGEKMMSLLDLRNELKRGSDDFKLSNQKIIRFYLGCYLDKKLLPVARSFCQRYLNEVLR